MRKYLLKVGGIYLLLFILLIILLPKWLFGQSQKSDLFQPMPLGPKETQAIQKQVKNWSSYSIVAEKMNQLLKEKPENLQFNLETSSGEKFNFELSRKDFFKSDFKVTNELNQALSWDVGLYYQGKETTTGGRLAAFSFFKNELMGVFSTPNGNYVLTALKANGKTNQQTKVYVLYDEADLIEKPDFPCEAESVELPNLLREINSGNSQTLASNCKKPSIFFECDFQMYQDFGSNTTSVANYVTGLFNVVNQLYFNEGIELSISQVFVWTSQDTYPTSSSLNILVDFRTKKNGVFNGNLAHLLSTRPLGFGGIAYTPGLCQGAFAVGYSNIATSFSALPNYSFSTMCVAHELGHNFGSKHTHWCGWQLSPTTTGPIDTCYTVEANPSGATPCFSGAPKPKVGTIMSYCHINASINLSLGFGPLPRNTMRNRIVNQSNCIAGTLVDFFSVSAPRKICNGASFSLSASSVSNGNYSWTGPNGFSSTLQNPTLSNASNAASGNYSLVVTQNGCSSPPKTVSVDVGKAPAAPLLENFSANTFPPTDWKNINLNNDAAWVRGTPSGFGIGSGSCRFDNFNAGFNALGTTDTLLSPTYLVSGASSLSLKVDIAYAVLNGWGTDTLLILASTDCGNTFSILYKKGGSNLASAPNTAGLFTPTSSQWRTENINLNAYLGTSQIQLAFVNKCGWGNNVFLDNVQVVSGGASGTISLLPQNNSTLCLGSTFQPGFNTTGAFNSGNIFTAELSDANGNFTSPIQIGNGATSPLACLIPNNLPIGSGYQIRIRSSNPVVVSAPQALNLTVFSANAGSNQNTCLNSAAFNLSGTPAGGSWTGTGVSSTGTFTPAVAGLGSTTLTYTAFQNGCSASDQVQIQVNAALVVNAGTDKTFCVSAPSSTLTGSPAGGSWSGTGVNTAGLFSPAGLNGSYILVYTVTQNGCTISDQMVATVEPSLVVNAGTNRIICTGASPINLTGSPGGGTWSGNGVSAAGLFTPSASIIGSQTLTYSVSSGSCSGSDQVVITVRATPTVNAGTDQSTCSDGAGITLAGFSPTGGVWTGPGIVSGNQFQPGVSGAGNHVLTYAVSVNGCTGTDTKSITVFNPPVVSAGTDQNVCAGAGNLNLSGTPSGGIWSGVGVNQSGVFNPGGLSGNYTLTYSVTQNGCTGTDQTIVNVNTAAANVQAGADFSVCENGNPVQINGTPAGGVWSGQGISAAGIFTPSSQWLGNQTLTYTYTNGACTGSDVLVAQVKSLPNVNAGPDRSVCASGGIVSFSASPQGGSWSGTGITSNGSFNPNGLTGSVVLTYSVTVSGCSNQDQVNVAISNNTVVVNAGQDQVLCAGQGNVNLFGTPAGGSWSGNGVSGAGVFSPGSVGSFTLIYSLASGACSGTDSVQISVNAPPQVSAGPDESICQSAVAVQLTGSPIGGSWSGSGVDASGNFIPNGNPGSVNLTYSATENGCTGSDTKVILIKETPEPLSISVTDTMACQGQTLTASVQAIQGISLGWQRNGQTISGQTQATLAIKTSGNYTVQAIKNGCSASSAPVRISFIAPPAKPTITISNQKLMSSTGVSFQWFLNGNSLADSTKPNLTPTQSGLYAVRVSNGYCSSVLSDGVFFTVTSNELVESSKPSVNLFPNPNSGRFYLKLSNVASENAYLEIFDLQGRKIKAETLDFQRTSEIQEIDLQTIPAGMYLVKIHAFGFRQLIQINRTF